MKRILAAVLLLFMLGTLLGCRKQGQQLADEQKQEQLPEAPNALVPCIVYQGELYRITGKELAVEVDESAIAGYVTSVVPLTQLPEEEGQTNFPAQDAPYAMTDEGLVVLVENEWRLFRKEGEAEPTKPPAVEDPWISQEQAMGMGFVVVQDGDVCHNQAEWMRYLTAAENKEPACVTVMQYFRTEEGWRQIRMDLSCDGMVHTLIRRENGEKTEKTYEKILTRQIPLDDSREPYDSAMCFLLANGEEEDVLFEDLIADADVAGVREIALHLKEGEPALCVYSDTQNVEEILSLLSHGEYLFAAPEEYYYGAKLLMTNGRGEQLVIELDLNQGNYRYGMQTYCYGDVSDLLRVLGFPDWPEEVYAEHGSYIK